MDGRFSRMEMLYGADAMERLARARVAVFGLGGVGGYVAEALARSGVGALDLVDSDRVSLSNLNRQILALEDSIGMLKTDAAEERIRRINPACRVTKHTLFYLPESRGSIALGDYSYIADAVDTVTAKLLLAEGAQEAGVPIISAMGTGNKRDPALLELADLYDTAVCPLARVMRKECRKRGIRHLTVVYSREEPAEATIAEGERRAIPGSCAFVPATAGLLMAARIVNDLARGA